MKVALYNVTTTTKTGGVESFVWELARYLARQYPACQVDIIGGTSPSAFQAPPLPDRVRILTRPFVNRDRLRRWPLLRRLYGQTKLLERLSFGLNTLALLRRERYDLIHIQKPYDLPIARLAERLWGSRTLFGCHGKDFFGGDRLFVSPTLPAVSCSRYNARIVHAHYGLLPQVVYNGIDTDLFSPRSPRLDLREELVGSADYVILQVGRQVRWKGAQYVIEALALLQEQYGLSVKLLLAGDGPYRHDLQGRAYRLGVAESVVFLGNLPNTALPDYYALADVVVGTSFANETFGISLGEAAACERPVVASDFGGFKEVVRDGQTGYLYPPQDAAALADRLANLLTDPTRRTQFGQAGRRIVVENFSWPRVAERVYQEYETILGLR